MGRNLGIPDLELTLEAARAAITDAGLQVEDLDGVATMGTTHPKEVNAALGTEWPIVAAGMGYEGLLTPLVGACEAVEAGRARHVLVYRTVQMMGGTILPSHSVKIVGASEVAGGAPPPDPMAGASDLLANHAYSAANWLALHCKRHMHLYGTTREQLGALAINSRKNAGLNPLAAFQSPMTMEDYLSARRISEPFGLLDCDVPVDGSIAFVVSLPEHAASCDHAVCVEAWGGASGAGGWYQRADFPAMASTDAASEMWSRTDLGPGDMDFAQLYDGFTFLTFAWLEALGFCDVGDAGPFVESAGKIAIDGEFPLNTYGGQLSAGRMHGYWLVHEACLQLRGQAGERQVRRHELAVAAAGGGPIAGSLVLARA